MNSFDHRLSSTLSFFLQEELSIVEPSFYAKRFFNFISTQVLDNSDSSDIQTITNPATTNFREKGSLDISKEGSSSIISTNNNNNSQETSPKEQTSSVATPLSPRANTSSSPAESRSRSISSL
jgi:hypothetical protein